MGGVLNDGLGKNANRYDYGDLEADDNDRAVILGNWFPMAVLTQKVLINTVIFASARGQQEFWWR